nr:MAG TPA: hypothetical protein [Caudoviricetes sp.]
MFPHVTPLKHYMLLNKYIKLLYVVLFCYLCYNHY